MEKQVSPPRNKYTLIVIWVIGLWIVAALIFGQGDEQAATVEDSESTSTSLVAPIQQEHETPEGRAELISSGSAE